MTQGVSNQFDMFADDTTLHACIPSAEHREEVAASLQRDLDKIHEWSLKWLVTLNAAKTQSLAISRKRVLPPSQWHPPYSADLLKHPHLLFGGVGLSEVSHLDLLGLTLTESLCFGKHVSKVAKRGGSRLGVLRRVGRFVSTDGQINLYKAFIRPLVEYCSHLWEGAPGMDAIDAIQRTSASLMGAPPSSLAPLRHRRVVGGLTYYFKLVNSTSPTDLLPPSKLSYSPRYRQPHTREIPTSTANFHLNSFIPLYTRYWNALPYSVVEDIDNCKNPLETLKKRVNMLPRLHTQVSVLPTR
eukprot:GHVN01088141.1.p1 GENE.GHVN01088141.1~~GHVN01088141.1.p1  ORF type:complete len:299 (-),score=30.35 GHVN01088141.1:76-972(-)